MSQSQSVQNVGNTLTDGTGISKITGSKFIKDFVADALMGIPPALLAVGVTGIPQDQATTITAIVAIGGAVIGAIYRGLLRWSTT
jgi:hypothetical protein